MVWEYEVIGETQTKKGAKRYKAQLWKLGSKKRTTISRRTLGEIRDHVAGLNSGLNKPKGDRWLTLAEVYAEWLKINTNTDAYLSETALYWAELEPLTGTTTADRINKLYLKTLNKTLLAQPARTVLVKAKKKGEEDRLKTLPKPGQRTINKKVAFIRMLVSFAHDNGFIPHNPVGDKFKKPTVEKKRRKFWGPKDAQAFLTYADKRYPLGSPRRWIYVLYLLAINTGLRAGEIWAFRPSCLLEDLKAEITEQWVRKEKRFRHLKGKAHRVIPINAFLKKELELLAEQRRRDGYKRTDLFWSYENGSPIDHKNFCERFFAKDLERSGILRRITFHGLRHTAATLMLRQTKNYTAVQTILGHEELSTTLEYLHDMAEDVDDMALNFAVTPEQTETNLVGFRPNSVR